MKHNHNYILKATSVNAAVKLKDFEPHFESLKERYNEKTVRNPKEIDSFKMSDSENEDNVIIINLWTEKPLPAGRELQSVRRISEGLLEISDGKIIASGKRVLKSK